MATLAWKSIAGASKKATVVPGNALGSHEPLPSTSFRASVSYGGAVPLAFTPFVDKVPASRTVGMLPGVYGSVAAAQDVCAADLACLGIRAQDRGAIALLYPGCSKPQVITDLQSAPGTTTWVKRAVPRTT